MEMGSRIIELLVTPPGIVILLLVLTFLSYLRSHWFGSGMLVLSTALLVALSLPGTAHWLLADLQHYAGPPELVPMADSGPNASILVPKASLKNPPQAIVVLGSGRYPDAPEYDSQDTVGQLGLERLRYAAYLQHKTGVPILVSGGSPDGKEKAEADLMKAVLTDEFKANVKWMERQSRNTIENARFTQAILANEKIKHVYLVTHAWHMRRAARAFEAAGIQVTPAPLGFQSPARKERDAGYLPSAWGMYLTSLGLRERLALFWTGQNDNHQTAPTDPAASAPATR